MVKLIDRTRDMYLIIYLSDVGNIPIDKLVRLAIMEENDMVMLEPESIASIKNCYGVIIKKWSENEIAYGELKNNCFYINGFERLLSKTGDITHDLGFTLSTKYGAKIHKIIPV